MNCCGNCGHKLKLGAGLLNCGNWTVNYDLNRQYENFQLYPDRAFGLPNKLVMAEMPACNQYKEQRKAQPVERSPMPPELLKVFRDLPRAPVRPPHFAEGGRWFCDVHGEFSSYLAHWDEFYEEHKNCHKTLLS
jgi:hypothetical protein